MLIRSKLIRNDGTMVTLGKGADARHYHFKPRDTAKPDEDHVCEVTNKDDVATFLAIREGYEQHEDTPAKPALTPAQMSAAAQSGHRQTSTEPSGSRPSGVTEGLSEREKSTAQGGNFGQLGINSTEGLSNLSRAELLKRVEDKTGTKQNPAMPTAKLIEMLKE